MAESNDKKRAVISVIKEQQSHYSSVAKEIIGIIFSIKSSINTKEEENIVTSTNHNLD